MLSAALLAACGSSNNKNVDGGGSDSAQEHAPDVAVGDAVGDAVDVAVGDAPDVAVGDATGDKAGDAVDAPSGDLADATDAAPACMPVCGAGLACVNGACLAAPVVLAQAPGCGAARLALGGGYVYWTERATGNVKRVAVSAPGATPTIVAAGQAKPGPIAADDTAAYWSNEGDLSIAKSPHASAGAGDGGAATPLLTAPAAVKGLAASGGFLYYSAGPSTFRVASTGGAPLALATFASCKLSQPVALALDVDHVYQTDVLSQFITRERSDGTQLANDPCAAADAGAPQIAVPDVVTHSQGELLLDAIGVSDGEVYWADNTTISAKPVNGTTTTTSRQVAFSLGGNVITGFVLSGGGFVYFGEGGDFQGGPTANTIQIALAKFSEEAGADFPRVVAEDQPGAASFAVGPGRLYWTTHAPSATTGAADDCTIVSLPQ